MKERIILTMLRRCIYKRNGFDKASVATLKDVINRIANKHIYCSVETRKSKLSEEDKK